MVTVAQRCVYLIPLNAHLIVKMVSFVYILHDF